MEVIGALCQLKAATGVGSAAVDLKAQMNDQSNRTVGDERQDIPLLFDIPQVPNLDSTFIASTQQ